MATAGAGIGAVAPGVVSPGPKPEGRLVAAHDMQLHVIDAGSGPPIVWLHGGGPGASSWSNFASNIDAFGGFRNLLFDQPQFGGSDRPVVTEPRDQFNAARLAAALEGLGVERAHFVGNSLGGTVAVRLAVDYPHLVDRLVVMAGGGVNPAVDFSIDAMDRPMGGVGPSLREFWSEGATRETVHAFLRMLVHDEGVLSPEIIDERLQAASDPELADAWSRSTLTLSALAAELHRVEAKTLLVWGREDAVVSLENALIFLRGIPNARLVVLPFCGHWVQYEQRDSFNRVVLDFLAEQE